MTTVRMPTGPSQETAVGPAAYARNLVKVYGTGEAAVRALDGVSVSFGSGRFTAIMGPSGSGKSTLMHCLAGLDTATDGQVFVGTTELTKLSDSALTRLRRDRIGFVFQAYNLLPQLTAAENIMLPLRLAGRQPDQGRYEQLTQALGLTSRLSHRPTQLSGGQQQRVAVARALIGEPTVVFADEPTGNLDSRSGAEVLEFLRQSVRGFGQTVVMVTHDPVAAAYADRVVLLADGRLAGEIVAPTHERVVNALRDLSV